MNSASCSFSGLIESRFVTKYLPPQKADLALTNKAKASDSYIAHLTGTKPDQPCFTIIGSGG